MLDVVDSLLSALINDRLVAVAFVLDDHLQLQFDEANMNVEVWPRVQFNGRWLGEADAGYGDSLRHLCGARVTATSERTGDGLRVELTTGSLHINPTLDEVHAEIAVLHLDPPQHAPGPGPWMCWRPGEGAFEHLRPGA